MTEDRIYSTPLSHVGDFTFDDAVADVFPDMIRRSVPGYGSMLTMIGQTAARYSVPKSRIYDLGCSLGAGTRLLANNACENCTVIAVDSSQAMVRRLQTQLAADPLTRVEVRCEDIRETKVSQASVVVLNLTLQFVPLTERDELLTRIAAGMLPDGALLLSEKICFADPQQQQLMTDLHHDFKRAHGYSDLEIAQKRTAIENRLIPETLEAHISRLHNAGFQTVVPWFQCFNFASLLAIR